MLKKISLVGLLLAVCISGFSFINNYEHLYLYPYPYSYGVGKAINSIDALDIEGFLFNPGLASSKFSIKVTSVSLMFNTTGINILGDLSSVLGADSTKTVSYALDLIGKPINLGAHLGLVSLNIPISDFNLALGILNLNLTPFIEFHNPLSSAGFLDTRLSSIFSGYIGLNYSFKNILTGDKDLDKYLSQLSVGLNLKIYLAGGIEKNFGIDELIQGNVNISGESLLLNLLTPRIAPDFGILYKIPTDGQNGEKQRVNIGISAKDIGGIILNNKVLIPTTFNLGVSYFIDLSEILDSPRVFKKNYVALDLHDIFFQRRDKDFFKRVHMGIHSEVFNLNDLINLRLGLGINQGYPSFGLGLKLVALDISFSVYTEELGVYAGQDPDTRYVLSISLGY